MNDNKNIYNFPKINSSSLYGNIDGIELVSGVAQINGWIFDSENMTEIEVKVLHNDRVIGRQIASLQRPDVKAAGAPTSNVGFKIPIQTDGTEKYLKIYAKTKLNEYKFDELPISISLPKIQLTRENIISAFRLLFLREPESEEAILHQLESHSSIHTLLTAFFKSPEFYEKNSDIVKIIQNKYSGEK